MRKYSYRAPVRAESPASKVMDKAIDLAIEEKSPYPDKSTFIDADTPHTDREIKVAAKEGQSAVVVSADGSARVISPEKALGKDRDAA